MSRCEAGSLGGKIGDGSGDCGCGPECGVVSVEAEVSSGVVAGVTVLSLDTVPGAASFFSLVLVPAVLSAVAVCSFVLLLPVASVLSHTSRLIVRCPVGALATVVGGSGGSVLSHLNSTFLLRSLFSSRPLRCVPLSASRFASPAFFRPLRSFPPPFGCCPSSTPLPSSTLLSFPSSLLSLPLVLAVLAIRSVTEVMPVTSVYASTSVTLRTLSTGLVERGTFAAHCEIRAALAAEYCGSWGRASQGHDDILFGVWERCCGCEVELEWG